MPIPTVAGPVAWWRRQLTGEIRIARLRSALAERTESLATSLVDLPHGKQQVLDEVRRLLKTATDALEAGDPNSGWALLLEAERVAVGADTDEGLQARAELLREEVREKLGGWRQLGTARILGDPGSKATLEHVQIAIRIRNEHFHNQYHKLDLVARQLARLGLLLIAVLATVLILATAGVSPLGVYAPQLAWAALLGGTGGLLSATRGLTQSTGRKIPDQLANWPITLVRPLLGAVAGLAAWLVVQTGVVELAAADTRVAPLVAAFFAGFSERYFLSLVPGGEK